ncbi:hypothetical protein J6590_079095 [Homalodisca vitripennis]|nr:hypothetical protein J6590_079095 [Homalodisca vitripennis]
MYHLFHSPFTQLICSYPDCNYKNHQPSLPQGQQQKGPDLDPPINQRLPASKRHQVNDRLTLDRQNTILFRAPTSDRQAELNISKQKQKTKSSIPNFIETASPKRSIRNKQNGCTSAHV